MGVREHLEPSSYDHSVEGPPYPHPRTTTRRKRRRIVLEPAQVDMISVHTWSKTDAHRRNLLPDDVEPVQKVLVSASLPCDPEDDIHKEGGYSTLGTTIDLNPPQSGSSKEVTKAATAPDTLVDGTITTNISPAAEGIPKSPPAAATTMPHSVITVDDDQGNAMPVAANNPSNPADLDVNNPSFPRSNGRVQDHMPSVSTPPPPPVIVRSHTLNTLPDITHETCAVCIDDFEEGDVLRVLPCGHGFHKECIDPWLIKKSVECPLCKSDVRIGLGIPISGQEESEPQEPAPVHHIYSRNYRRDMSPVNVIFAPITESNNHQSTTYAHYYDTARMMSLSGDNSPRHRWWYSSQSTATPLVVNGSNNSNSNGRVSRIARWIRSNVRDRSGRRSSPPLHNNSSNGRQS
ncbi:hypothetical protein EV182_002143 [Spiromyces aspiralis]|uniref:Uncharacterized protein n=1 Tax=Spiromyces aspiralis TaxID=68401 RepID=A0ACC1HIE7_9FUNG|nr:hypothetical protein EV182_002143 [Spiromyces aspiralis]